MKTNNRSFNLLLTTSISFREYLTIEKLCLCVSVMIEQTNVGALSTSTYVRLVCRLYCVNGNSMKREIDLPVHISSRLLIKIEKSFSG